MVARILIALVGVSLGLAFCIAPVAKLGEIASFWWKWHDVPGASIHNLEEIHYEIGRYDFPNGLRMYVVIFGQIAIGILAMGTSVIMVFQPPRQR
ncbi:MAG: hypothetical protein H0W78_19450 [Planctomycetes bacterium]|nr:hypothetical protein [Planctomycetota bacterium]